MHGGERRSNVAKFLRQHFADEFQSDMKVLRSHPPRLRRKRAKHTEKLAETFPHSGRNLQCHEQAHRSRPFASVRRRLAAIVEKMDPHHVQRELRCMPANRFAVAGEAHAALFHSARMRNRDVYRANGFFFASPPGPAMPVMPTPSVLPTRRRMPSASAIPPSLLTAPFDLRISGGTSAQAVFSSLL